MGILEDADAYISTDAPPEGRRAHANSPIKLDALKELAHMLLKEVEAIADARAPQAKGDGRISLAAEVRRFESDLIRWALVRTNGHQRRAARLLNVKVTTLNAKIKRYGIVPDTHVIDLLDTQ